MLAYTTDMTTVQEHVESSLEELQEMKFITVDRFSNFETTLLGSAIVASALDPQDGIFIHDELQRALKAFVLDGEMHILYNFTPVHDLGGVSVNWRIFWNEMEQLDESGLRVMNFLGLKPGVVNKM